MSDAHKMKRIVEISQVRCRAAESKLVRADRAVYDAAQTLAASERKAKDTVDARDRLKAAAQAAFFSAPQSAGAVIRLIENNAAEDQKAKDAWAAVDAAKLALETAEDDREQARIAYAKAEHEVAARDSAARKLARLEQRRSAARSEAALADERAFSERS